APRACGSERDPLSLHDALPISARAGAAACTGLPLARAPRARRAFALGLAPLRVPRVLPRGRAAGGPSDARPLGSTRGTRSGASRSEEHTSELQSRENLVCRLLL